MSQGKGEQVYRTERFDVMEVDLKKRSGGALRRGYIRTADAVVVLPIMPADKEKGETEEKVVLIRNERFALGKVLWELPAGTLERVKNEADNGGDDGVKSGEWEDIDLAAGRELAEETGYVAGRIERMSGFYCCPGMVTEKLHGYLARDLRFVGQKLDETEQITTVVVPMSKTMEMIQAGEIEDAKSIALILFYSVFKS
ncbi:NUDIX hydrolase [Planctomycetota bacterium]|nr:NUDIX hydrolase [Planctomycetota bacterium]